MNRVDDYRRALQHNDAFYLELDGVAAAGFVSCSGLSAQRDVLEYREGGAEAPRMLPGNLSFGPLRFERGVVSGPSGHELFDWFGRGDRRDGAVVLVGRQGREVSRWQFRRAWPSAWYGPELEARDAAVALEALELVHEGLEWTSR